ncbi:MULTISPECIES: DUF2304 domain-containing protein [unclassified Leucobacter]|uniref:DUF2304 domain-containing protein n=1 Tax=unclassified Leucobacter TaxID=2621730 RepID=UPI00165E6421|nr:MULTISPECIES: DUF2304 domain-containing protein [unclassified Leucobacter]MBC9936598.1 DUF2304 domain-containing protein [Leucobacter sp. cx-87]
MTIFQFLLIVAVCASAFLATRFMPGDRSLAIKRLLTLLFVAAAILAIIFPNTLTAIAHFLGIGRGTDLLLYLFMIAALLYAVSTVRAQARRDARTTELARAVALMEARLIEQRAEPPRD